MQIFKCDRCGGVYENPIFTFGTPKYTITKHSFPDTTEVDLCPNCCALLEKFMQGVIEPELKEE